MKKYVVLLILSCAAFAGNAQPMNDAGSSTMLKVRTANNMPINVAVDGRYFNKRGSSITVGDLPPGKHILKIFSVAEGRRGRGYEEVIYEGKVRTHDGMVTVFQFDPATQDVQVDEQDINAYLNEHPNVAQQQNDRQQGAQGNDYYNNGYNNSNEGRGQNYNPAPPPPTGTLTDAKVDNLKTQVATKNTDTEKMKVLRDALDNETFTTYQIGNMMDLFSFESSKLDFAEWAYPKTVDKNAFSDLAGKFTYQNYRDDLNNFLKTK